MDKLEKDSFEIPYYGVTIKITPVFNGNDMQYLVNLPTRKVLIEVGINDTTAYWREVNAGQTTLAEEIGAIIEESEE